MKHLFRVVALLGVVAWPGSAYAQTSGGIRAGVNLANLSLDPEPPSTSEVNDLTGLVAGAFVTLPSTGSSGFSPRCSSAGATRV